MAPQADPYFESLPSEAYEMFVNELDPKELAELVKVDYRMAERVFHGFRPGAAALKSQVVVQRIAREVERDRPFRMVLLQLWADTHLHILDVLDSLTLQQITKALPKMLPAFGGLNLYLALVLDERVSLQKLAKKRAAEIVLVPTGVEPPRMAQPEPEEHDEKKPDRVDKLAKDLKAAKDRAAHLTKENRDLEQRVKLLRKNSEVTKADAAKANADFQGLRHEHAQLLKQTGALSRERDSALEKVADLERSVKNLRRALDSSKHEPRLDRTAPRAPWQDAVHELLKEKKHQSAIDFLTAFTKLTNDDPLLHELLMWAYHGAGQKTALKKELIFLGRMYLDAGRLGPAIDRLCRALAMDPNSSEVISLLRAAFSRADPRNELRMSEIRRTLLRLRGTVPKTRELALAIAKEVSPALALALEEAHGSPEPDRLFSLKHDGITRQMTPRQIAEAIDLNEEDTVRFLRAALRSVSRKSSNDQHTVWHCLREHDDSCCVTLSTDTEPVIVDASNVAFHLTTSDGKPRLRNIIMLRQELRRRCYFPTYLCADAALPHQVDRPSELRRMIDIGQIELADSGTDADEMILNRARQMECAVVTRDAMLDWDPEGEVTKIRFEIDHDFVVLFDADRGG